MEFNKVTAALEISEEKVKFLIGENSHGRPSVLYYDEAMLEPGIIEKGNVIDPEALGKAIRKFSDIKDESLRLKVAADSVALVLPPIGFSVYETIKQTSTISPAGGAIEGTDIVNAINLVYKERLPEEVMAIEIVPDFFSAGGTNYATPPIGVKSDYISVQAKVHALPRDLVANYQRAVGMGGFRVSRCEVAPYLVAQMLQLDEHMPRTCIYVDIGSHLTSISLLSEGMPFASLCLNYGGSDIDSYVARELRLPLALAKTLKEDYGYDSRQSLYEAPLYKGANTESLSVSIRQKDLNKAIKGAVENFQSYLWNAVTTLINGQEQQAVATLMSMPVVLGGGGALLNGLRELLDVGRGAHELSVYRPRVVGAADPSFVELLGMVAVCGTYRGALTDEQNRIGNLSRYERK